MNADVLSYLRCPICELPLTESGAGPVRAVRCGRRHSFDIARQGYVNLSAGRAPHSGDTADMVQARQEFLDAGHYDFLSTALRDAAAGPVGPTGPAPPLVVDAGAGTGHHLARVLDRLPAAVGLALDVSKPALRRAARTHPRAAAALCDTWGRIPLADASAALLLNVFAPRNGPEFRRVLRPDGTLLVVVPAADHLRELVGPLRLLRVDPAKAERVAGSLGRHFEPVGESAHRRRLSLRRTEVRTLVRMGPSAWHAEPVRLAERLAALSEPISVTASVLLTAYRPR
ncbi:MAG TPA: 23S rRNA methyltransferase [Micromonosporaceae bacterium]